MMTITSWLNQTEAMTEEDEVQKAVVVVVVVVVVQSEIGLEAGLVVADAEASGEEAELPYLEVVLGASP